MTPRDFIYWLQGYIELSGKDLKPMTDDRLKMLHAHVDMALTTSSMNPKIVEGMGKSLGFCYTLKGMLVSNNFNLDVCRNLLHELFIHQIDPLHGGEAVQHALNTIHQDQIPDSWEDYSQARCQETI